MINKDVSVASSALLFKFKLYCSRVMIMFQALEASIPVISGIIQVEHYVSTELKSSCSYEFKPNPILADISHDTCYLQCKENKMEILNYVRKGRN